MSEVVRIIKEIEGGNVSSSEQLLPLVYAELKSLASRRLATDGEQSLQTTELVHEVYLRLVGPDQQWKGRAHFFGAAAEAMRRVLVDRARARNAEKRGSNYERVEWHDSAMASGFQPHEVLVVDELFDRLSQKHPIEAEVAKLRYFAGFSHREAAEALEISTSMAHAHWTFAKAWLYREFSNSK